MILFAVLCAIFVSVSFAGNKGIAFSFSGAGGRISQHAAMLSCLINGTYPLGVKIRPEYIAGASSGALTAVLLSAILQTQEQRLPHGITFDQYKNLLFNLDDGDVFADDPLSIAKIFASNIPDGFILDNAPFEATLSKWLSQMNYYVLGDLYIPTAISVVDQNTGFTKRLWSDNPKHAQLNLLEVLMASIALPIAFEPRTITGFPGTYIDGGTSIDTIPIIALLDRPEVTTIYVIVYNSALSSGGSSLPFPINKIKLLANVMATISDMRVDLFDAALDVVADDNNTQSFLYLPTLPRNYSTLDFSDEQQEYTDTYNWASKHNPVPVTKWSLNAIRTQFHSKKAKRFQN